MPLRFSSSAAARRIRRRGPVSLICGRSLSGFQLPEEPWPSTSSRILYWSCAHSSATPSTACSRPKSTSRNIPGYSFCLLDQRVTGLLSKASCTYQGLGLARSLHDGPRATSCPSPYTRNSPTFQSFPEEAVWTTRMRRNFCVGNRNCCRHVGI